MKHRFLSAALAFVSLWSFGQQEISATSHYADFRDFLDSPLETSVGGKFEQPTKSLDIYADGPVIHPESVKNNHPDRKLSPLPKALPASVGGTYVMTVKSLRPDLWGDTGNSVTVEPIANADSVWLHNFWENGINIKAAVDLTKGTVSIPNQKIGVNSDGVTVDFAFCDNAGKPVRSKKVEGVINADGTISVTSWWGLYAVDGPNKDRYAFAGGDTEFERANATMSFNFMTGEKITFGVVVSQPFDNQVLIKNFGNYGQTVKIWLDSSRGGSIPTQCARIYPSNKANFMTMSVGHYTSSGNPSGMTNTIHLTPAPAGSDKTLKWGKWSAFSIGTVATFFGSILDGTIEYSAGFHYPPAVTGSFEGSGTESDPYLIKTITDLERLANETNTYTAERPDTIGGFISHLAFTGKHFKLAADINLSSRLLTPIGADFNHLFNGVFDGNGHTLTGLNQQTGGAGLAGLFGMCGPASVIKNVKMSDALISAEGLIASVLAGWSYGTITGCSAENVKVYNTQRIAAGLVGAAETISDCHVNNAYIDGRGGNSAGLVGQVNVSIDNCYVTNARILAGSATEGYPAGGVVASMNGAKGRNLYFSGSIDSKVYVSTLTIGGIAGILSNGSLESCYAVGSIESGVSTSGMNAVAGGVVGTNIGSDMADCYFIGSAGTYYSRMAGGITGWVKPYVNAQGTRQPSVRNCYTASVITSETYLYDSENEVRESLGYIDANAQPTIENVYFDNQYTNLNSKKYGVPGSFLTSAKGPEGFSTEKWVFTEGQYPRLKGMDDTQTAFLSSSSILFAPQSSLKKLSANAALRPMGNTKFSLLLNGRPSQTGRFCKIENDSILISDQFGTDTLAVTNGDMTLLYEVKVAPVPFAGEGTELNPYLISTKEDMIALGHITSVVKQYFPQTYFLMTNDIDMQYDPLFTGICIDKDAYCKFAGVFDGGGHTLDNVLVNWVVWKKAPVDENDVTGVVDTNNEGTQNVKGIFGRLAVGGIIRNLKVGAGCKLNFWARSGAIVGQNEGLVENCRNYAPITTVSSVAGGIVGENRKGTVRRCYNAAPVTSGYNSAGGIVGTGNGVIEQCVNAGDVSLRVVSTFQKESASMLRAGGIQGENTGTNFSDCVNYGTVRSYQSMAGGISGQLSKITSTSVMGNNSVKNSLSLGSVKVAVDRSLMGAIGGNSGTEGEIYGTFWDSQLIPLKAQGGMPLQGAQGLETSVLVSGEPLAGYDTTIWSFEKGMYPTLKEFADEPKVAEARSLILMLPASTDINNLTDGATLESKKATWSLADASAFKIEGNKLISPSDVKEKVSDELTLLLGSFTRKLEISCPPAIPLAGKGTESEPYLITSAADWNALSDYASSTGNDFSGKYLKIVSDIDFAGTTFKSLFSDGVTNFAGTLDGDSHSVKGISMKTTASYQAAIGTIAAGATVKNLTIAGEITSAQTYTGGFSAKVYGDITNCVNAVNVTSTKASVSGFGYIYGDARLTDVTNNGHISGGAGSVAGIASATSPGVVFTRVFNKGVIESTATGTASYIGGLVAQCQPAVFTSCGNEGSFVIKNQTGANSVGGLVAYANGTAGSPVKYSFTDCYNRAPITANSIVGGIVANSNASTSIINPLIMKGCVNHADLATVSTKAVSSAPTAGIVALYTPGTTIEDCVNEGDISSKFNVYVSGIAGSGKGTPNEANPVLLKRCENHGNITATGNQGAGIVALTTNYVTVSHCSNTGSVKGGFNLGGLVAQLGGNNVEIAYSWNSGDIETTSNRTGGLIGSNTVVADVHDCFNTGNISTTCETPGTSNAVASPSGYAIGGLAGYGAATFRRCYNTGSVKGASRVGGLVGQTYKNRTVIDSCYNSGTVIAPADTCGYIIGVSPRSGKDWNTDNRISDTYYVKGDATLLDSGLAIGITEAELAEKELGAGWNSGDIYTYPMLTDLEPAEAKIVAARVIAGKTNGENVFAGPFHVGCPQGLVWNSENSSLLFEGNNVSFKDAVKGNVKLVATCEDLTREVVINVDAVSAVTDLDTETGYTDEYFTADGLAVSAENLGKGVYVRIRTYSDGRRESKTVIL